MALFLILAPFATFATLMLLTTVKISLAASALVALGLVLRDMVEGRSIKMLPIGALVIFTSLAGYHFIAAAEMSPTSVRLAVDGSVLAIALVSIAIRLPFTIQHAREVVDAETAKLPHFMRTNYILTWVWSAAFVLMLLADMVTIYLPSTPLWVCAAIAFAARNTATYFTKWYPKHVRAGIAASANAAAA
ncbi:hypothetical protein [Afipia sp. DC4300-2b1]|uniref:hypothetical protein n=1 Tax=Afipia sp. DC4300-2b1 TaxID=2804672 RepID=UPI003CE762D5